MSDLTCIACLFFYFQSGHEGYSEMTPGHQATIDCRLGHWQVDMYEDDNESYRLKLLTANSCKDFEAYQK